MPFDYDPGALKDEEVEINAEYCGICHSDLSMLKNDWGTSQYPLVPGHAVVGTIAVLGDRVIGGLGHRALRFLQAWGCDVTAFSTTPDKEAEARGMGATHFINSRDAQALGAVTNSDDFILSTVNADLDWGAYVNALRPKGRLHSAGAAPNAITMGAFPIIIGQKSLSGSPLGSPITTAQMRDFAARHGIEPITETIEFNPVNEAMAHLEAGKARYRIVLKR